MSIFSGGIWNWCRGYTNGISSVQQEALKELANRVVNGEATKEDWEVIEKGSNIPVVQEVFELLKRIEKTCNPVAVRALNQRLEVVDAALERAEKSLEKSEQQIKEYQKKCATLTARAERSQEQIDTLLAVIEHQSLMLGFNVPASLQSKMPSKN